MAAGAHTAEVSGLKQSLERAEEELGPMKKQLEDNQVMQWPARELRKYECFVLTKVS